MNALLSLVLAYLIGSVPFSFLVARGFGVADVRREGSGNVGATNVLRTAGPVAGVLALLLDAAKGAVPVLVAPRLASSPAYLPELAAVTAVLGHLFPVWLGFRGGKGVATGAGAFLALAPRATLAALAVFVATVAVFRYVSVGSMLAAASLPLLAWALGARPSVCVVALLVAGLVVYGHRGNLQRLRAGTERRLGAPRA